MSANHVVGGNGDNNGGSGENQVGGGAGPFGIGTNPGVRVGETPGSPQVLGPQYSQHGSGAEVRTAPEGWPPLRPEAAGVDWGIFERARQAVSGDTEEAAEGGGGKRSKGTDGRSRSPLIGKFRTKIQGKRAEKSPRVTSRVKPRAAPTTTVEPPPPPPGMEGGWNRDGKRKVDGSPSVGTNGGGGIGSANGGGVTREEVYSLAWGLMQGMQGFKGNGKGGVGKSGEYYQDLDEKHFRRVDKFKGDKDRYKSWMYEVLTAIGVVNTRLQKELKELMKGYREQDKGGVTSMWKRTR